MCDSHRGMDWLVADPATHKLWLFCGGRLRSGRQKPVNVAAAVLMAVPAVLHWAGCAPWLVSHGHGALVGVFSYLWAVAFLLFVKASTTDPGLTTRNIHLPAAVAQGHLLQKPPPEYFGTMLLPYGDTAAPVKYCSTCHIWRPPRTSHCSTCDVCVSVHDHHCVFLNNCVGARNYKWFAWYLVYVVAASLVLAAASFTQVYSARGPFSHRAQAHPLALGLAVYSLLGLVYPLLLLLFHIFLTSQNITTREYLNYAREDPGYVNIYNLGLVARNLYVNWIGTPRGFSSLSMRRRDAADIRFLHISPFE